MVKVLEPQLKQRQTRKQKQERATQKQELAFEVDRGPGWLFVRLPDPGLPDPGMSKGNGLTKAGELGDVFGPQVEHLADQLWNLLNQHFVYRLVLEMDQVSLFSSSLMGQLVMLQKRVLQHDGALRLCGLSPQCQQALHLCRLDRMMPNFRNREDAVHGYAWSKPR